MTAPITLFSAVSLFQVQSKASTVSSGTRASAILNSNGQHSPRDHQQPQQQQQHSRNSMVHEQEKSSRVRHRSVSPNGSHDGDLYHQQQQVQQNGNYHHQSMTSVVESSQHHQSMSSINHQDVVMPYSKDIAADMTEENGIGHHQMTGGTSSKYSLLQFAAQHFRNE